MKLKVDVEGLKADATLKTFSIDFKDGLAPVLAKEVKLHYENRALYFTLDKPSYRNRDLEWIKSVY